MPRGLPRFDAREVVDHDGGARVLAKVSPDAAARGEKLRRFRAPQYRWGSILGLQQRGLIVVQPTGRRYRVPRQAAEPLLLRLFVTGYLYGGLRRARPHGRKAGKAQPPN